MIATRPDRGLRHVSEFLEEMTVTNQPTDKTELAAKLKHCQSAEVAGVKGCPYLNAGVVCGFRRLREGPHKGQFPTLTELDTCPRESGEPGL